MKSLKQFQKEAKDCCKKCGSYEHVAKDCPKKEETEVYWSSKALDQLDELNRYEKETGKSSGSLNMPKGKPTKKGGDSSPVMRAVRSSIRKETGKPQGQQKKEKGKKPPVAGEYGARRTPAQIVQKRREQKKAADAAMRDTRGT